MNLVPEVTVGTEAEETGIPAGNPEVTGTNMMIPPIPDYLLFVEKISLKISSKRVLEHSEPLKKFGF
jgi:hypothetical protein